MGENNTSGIEKDEGDKMTINNIIFIGCCIFLIIYSIIYIFSTFSYQISDDFIYIKWKILRYIPFNSHKIGLNQIETIRTFIFKKDILAGGDIWGNPFIKKGVIIKLEKGLIKNIYITPDNPKKFIEQVKNAKRRR